MTDAPDVAVFHGTRLSLSDRITADGFGHLSVNEQLADVAERFDVSLAELSDHLSKNGRFADRDDRDGTVSFATTSSDAAGWANRAPEATWEALWSIYRLRHPEIEPFWNQSDQGHLWVIAQQLADPPAVVTASAPLSGLYNHTMGEDLWTMSLKMAQEGSTPEELADLFESSPEWRAHAGPHLLVTAVEVVPTRVDGSLALFLSGEDPGVFRLQVRAGDWGPEMDAGPGLGAWFSLDQIWTRLTSERRTMLSEIAEVDIDEVLGGAKPSG